MPYSIVHIDLVNKKLKNKKISPQDKLDFFVGNIITDISYNLNSYWISIKREDTHYYTWQDYMQVDFANNFFLKENMTKNYLIYWYYYHLLTDKFWRDFEFEWRYVNEDIYNTYQISRKINSEIDLLNFEDKYLFDKLYNYKIENYKLPSVFYNISIDLIQKSYIDLLDYMTLKKTFSKWESNDKYKDLIEKYFSYDHHLSLKNKAFNEINIF